jgi:hypothetical protein
LSVGQVAAPPVAARPIHDDDKVVVSYCAVDAQLCVIATVAVSPGVIVEDAALSERVLVPVTIAAEDEFDANKPKLKAVITTSEIRLKNSFDIFFLSLSRLQDFLVNG